MKILKREEFMHSKDLLDVIFLLGTLQMKKKQYMRGKAQAFFFPQAVAIDRICAGFRNIHIVITHLSIALA